MQEEITQVEMVDARDAVLQNIVRLANEFDLQFSITLFSGGLIISGIIVGGATYFDRLGEQMEQAFKDISDDKFAAKMGGIFQGYGDTYKKRKEELRQELEIAKAGEGISTTEDQADSLEKVFYIHLQNVQILGAASGPVIYAPATIWRGRISSVDGFHLGSADLADPGGYSGQ